MADRYQDRPFATDADYDRAENPPARGESDPLAELARLIGQTDPFGAATKNPLQPPPHPLQSRANVRPQYDPPEDDVSAPRRPAAMDAACAARSPAGATIRRAGAGLPAEPRASPASLRGPAGCGARTGLSRASNITPDEQPADPSRYDDALYGQLESGAQEFARDPAYPDDPYAYQSGYDEEPEPRKRRSGLMTVVAVLALAVVGTGAAFAYRTYVGAPRSGEPPIIKADNSPTKVVPAPGDSAAGKTPDRMLPGDGGEKLVSREETPVDVNARSGGPRVVFPPLNQNGSPPPVASVSTGRTAAGDRRERHHAEQRAAQDQDPRREGRRRRERWSASGRRRAGKTDAAHPRSGAPTSFA